MAPPGGAAQQKLLAAGVGDDVVVGRAAVGPHVRAAGAHVVADRAAAAGAGEVEAGAEVEAEQVAVAAEVDGAAAGVVAPAVGEQARVGRGLPLTYLSNQAVVYQATRSRAAQRAAGERIDAGDHPRDERRLLVAAAADRDLRRVDARRLGRRVKAVVLVLRIGVARSSGLGTMP